MTTYELLQFFYKEFPDLVKAMSESDHNLDPDNTNPHHAEGSIWTHTCMTLGCADYYGASFKARLTLLLHDIGKPYARFVEDGKVKFYGHEGASFYLAGRVLEKLNVPVSERGDILTMIYHHTSLFKYNQDNILQNFSGLEHLWDDLVMVHRCDALGRISGPDAHRMPIDFETRMHVIKTMLPTYKEMPEGKRVVFMVGPPASGKSHAAKSVESLGYKLLGIDVNLERVAQEKGLTYSDVWRDNVGECEKQFNQDLDEAIRNNLNIVIDKTNMSKKNRNKLLNRLRGYVKVAIVMATPLEVILERNKNRVGKSVPESVIKQMILNFTLPNRHDFDSVMFYG